MTKRLLKKTLILFFFTLISFAAFSQENTPLRIAVAANFAPVLKKLIPEFTAQTNIETQVNSAASGTLFQQIKHGAPFDIFLSADTQRPQRLSDSQLIIENSLQTYAYGQLAFWSATKQHSTLASFLESIPTEQRLAIANPEIAPYGKAAKETLEKLKLWPAIQRQLVTGININQTFQQVRSQAVQFGIVANSQLVLNQLVGTVIPGDYHQEIKQQLVILKSSKQQENAKKFSEYLLSDNVQQQLLTFGYAKNTEVLI